MRRSDRKERKSGREPLNLETYSAVLNQQENNDASRAARPPKTNFASSS